VQPLEYPTYQLPSAEETRRIGQAIYARRGELGMSITQCAAKAGVPTRHWELLEWGHSPEIADEMLSKAARVLQGIGATKGGDLDL
jgi:hypothetical protein